MAEAADPELLPLWVTPRIAAVFVTFWVCVLWRDGQKYDRFVQGPFDRTVVNHVTIGLGAPLKDKRQATNRRGSQALIWEKASVTAQCREAERLWNRRLEDVL